MAELRMTREDIGKLVLRVSLAGILLFHGIYKIMNSVAWIGGPLSDLGLPGFLAYGTYLAEVLAPLLLIIGYKVRIAALVITFDMLMAVILVQRPLLFAIQEAGGGWGIELEALFFFQSLAVAFIGGGNIAVEKRST
ncbi:MAG: DoxX family protein [Gemmatimonadetes bacterium]|nr:DoxX family protein [Gemmatimonadota bacterium]